MHLAPLAPVGGCVSFAFALAFARELHARAVDEQLQWYAFGSARRLHLQMRLAPTQGAEVRRTPVEPHELEQTLHEAAALAQRQLKEAAQTQAALNGRIREHLIAPAFTAGRGVPGHETTVRRKNFCAVIFCNKSLEFVT
jgi:hypothetical protein